MARGRYVHLDPEDGQVIAHERFSCGPAASGPHAGPGASARASARAGLALGGAADGWRYLAHVFAPDGRSQTGTVEVAAGPGWRSVRVDLRTAGWVVRGGELGPQVAWVRGAADGTDAAEGSAAARSFTGRSPAFAVVTARQLAIAPAGSARVRLVALTEPVLAPHTVDQAWEYTELVNHPTETGPLPVESYQVSDLGTGERRSLHLAGDVVVAGWGVELAELDEPPTW